MSEAEVEDLYMASQYRAVTGVLGSHPESRDLQIINLSITFHGAELLTDTKLELNNGRRYGLIGLNGCGESQLGNDSLRGCGSMFMQVLIIDTKLNSGSNNMAKYLVLN